MDFNRTFKQSGPIQARLATATAAAGTRPGRRAGKGSPTRSASGTGRGSQGSVHKLVWSRYGYSFSVQLKSLRRARGLSQQALADISGISRNQISNLERNENNRNSMADPCLSTIYRLALALEVEPAMLLPSAQPRDTPQDLMPFPAEYVAERRGSLMAAAR